MCYFSLGVRKGVRVLHAHMRFTSVLDSLRYPQMRCGRHLERKRLLSKRSPLSDQPGLYARTRYQTQNSLAYACYARRGKVSDFFLKASSGHRTLRRVAIHAEYCGDG